MKTNVRLLKQDNTYFATVQISLKDGSLPDLVSYNGNLYGRQSAGVGLPPKPEVFQRHPEDAPPLPPSHFYIDTGGLKLATGLSSGLSIVISQDPVHPSAEALKAAGIRQR